MKNPPDQGRPWASRLALCPRTSFSPFSCRPVLCRPVLCRPVLSWPVLCWAAICVQSALLAPAPARAQEGSPVGSYELHGRRDDGALIAVRLQVSRRANGKLAVERHLRLRNQPGSRERWVKWRSFQVVAEGEVLRVVYTLPAFARRSGIVDRLRGRSLPVERRQNTIAGHYRFTKASGEVREVLANQTRLAPEGGWKSSLAVGGRHSRLRLGEERRLPAGGVLTLVLPCSGTLHLTGADLSREDGVALVAAGRAPGQGRAEQRYPVSPGVYRVTGKAGAEVRALLVQAAQLAGKDKPWTSESWYPIHEFERDGELNEDTLYREGGPLELFDLAFGLSGRQSAVAWERGDAGRPNDDFRNGHYHRRGEIREAQAELDAGIDLDGDGRIGGDPAALVRRLDLDRNGRVSQAELQRGTRERLSAALYRYYDYDKDGQVEIGSDLSADDAKVYDVDRDGLLSRAELKWILAGRGPLGGQARWLLSRWQHALQAELQRNEELSARSLRAGAHDFVDDRDLDRDGRESYEERNFVLRLRSGGVAVTNRYRRAGSVFELEGGRSIPAAEVLSIRRRADGDYADAYTAEWWGHCNGVAIAGILFKEPQEPIRFGGQTFSPEDLKGLLSEFALGQAGLHGLNWRRDYALLPLPDYTRDFHTVLRGLMPGRTSFMADVELKRASGGGEVWNYALIGYELELREAPGDDPRVLEVTARVEHTGDERLGLSYRLHFSEGGEIRTDADSQTTWSTRDRSGRLRFLRYLLATKPISGHAQRANPFVSPERLRQLFGGRLPYREAQSPALPAGIR